LLPF
jgi:hypothetical protein